MVQFIEITHDSNGEEVTEKFELDKIKRISRDGDTLTVKWGRNSHSDYTNGRIESLR